VTTLPDPTSASSLSRRTLIKHAGLAAAAIAGLSACTNYGAPGASQPSSAATSASGGASGASGVTAKTSDIPTGGGTIFAAAQTVITQPKAGEFKAFTAVCTHQQCIVADVTDTINCNCHGSKFSITDGSVVNPPAQTPLAAKKVTVTGQTITVA
jgi:nitrite reductase/ring-hydroxylating ferredoxin subunit